MKPVRHSPVPATVARTTLASAITALALSMATSGALAASLGRLQVLSAGGQPLVAEIEVEGIAAGEFETLKAGVADTSSFKAAQLDVSPVLARLRFEIVRGLTDDRATVRITSAEPLAAKALDAIVELTWSGGRIQREYTLPSARPVATQPMGTVDAPATDASAPAAVSAPVVPRPDVIVAGANDASKAPKASQDRDKALRPNADAAGRVVRKGDSLSQIAREVAPDAKSLNAAMAAIFAGNQAAFVNNSIHLLREGAVLDIPEEAELTRRSNRAALQYLAQHDDRADPYFQRLGAAPATVRVNRNPDSASSGEIGRVEAEKPPVKTEDQLKVSRSGKEDKSAESAANARAEELLIKDKALKEANDRIAALEKNIADMQRLLELKAAAGKADPAAATDKPSASTAPEATAPVTPPAGAVDANGKPVETALKPELPPAEADNAKPEAELAEEEHEDPAKQAKPWYQNGLILAGAGGAVVLAGGVGGFLFLRRRKSVADELPKVEPVADALADPATDLLNEHAGEEVDFAAADADLPGAEASGDQAAESGLDAGEAASIGDAGSLADESSAEGALTAGELAASDEATELAAAVDLEFSADEAAQPNSEPLIPPEMSAGDPPRPAAAAGNFADELDALSAQVGEASASLNALKTEAEAGGTLDDDFGITDDGSASASQAVDEQANAETTRRLSDTLASIDLDLPSAGEALPADPLSEASLSDGGDAVSGSGLDADFDAQPATQGADSGSKDDLARWQEMETKLDLAAAYIEIGDSESARDLLAEVQRKGDDAQQGRAQELLARAL